jgi:MOSC domain-containing protein YiiM
MCGTATRPPQALQVLADLGQQRAASYAYFDVFWVAAVATGAGFLVLLMKRPVAEKSPKREQEDDGDTCGTVVVRQRGSSPRDRVAREDRLHVRVEGVGRGPAPGPRLNVDGDAQGDLHGHGGEHRAVFVYQIDSYRYWERELKRSDFTFGQFGENFTVEGLARRGVLRHPRAGDV